KMGRDTGERGRNARVPHNLPFWQWGTAEAWFLPGVRLSRWHGNESRWWTEFICAVRFSESQFLPHMEVHMTTKTFDVQLRKIDDIRPYDRNPRINDQAVAAVAASLAEFGFRQPIVVDGGGVIIAGHTRWKAA